MEEVNQSLNQFLCDLNVFFRKLQNYHWNIQGESFFIIHEKLEEYRALLGTIPTDEKITLERVIPNPLTENEMDFCIN